MDGMVFPIPLPIIMNPTDDGKSVQEKTLEVQEEQLEQQVKFSDDSEKLNAMFADQIDLLGDIADKPAIKETKEKQVKFWDKIFKNKIFESTLKGIKGIASSLSGGLFDTLIGLMLWAFIDPNGSLMISLINIFVSLSVMLIRMFAKMIPVVLKMILKVLPVIINAISEIINTVIDVLPNIIDSVVTLMPLIFNTLAKAIPRIITKLMDAVILVIHKLQDKFPFLQPILQFIERLALAIKELFDPNSPLGIKERLLIFAKTLFSIFGDALLAGLQALIPLLGSLLDSLTNYVMESLSELGDSIHNYLLEHLGEKGMKALKGFGIALGIVLGILGALGVAWGVMIAYEYALLAVQWLKNFSIVSAIAPLTAYTTAMWASLAPFAPLILAILGFIAIFVLLYTFWDEIAAFFKKAWNWFIDNALDLLMIGIRILLLPWTFPIEAGWFIYKNWEKIKKKIMDGIKTFQQMFPNLSKWISDTMGSMFGNIKIGDVGDMIFKAFDRALLGIPSLLERAFSNIPGVETFRKGWEDLEKWFKTTIFYTALKKTGMIGGGDNEPKQFKDILSNMKSYGSTEVEKAKEQFVKTNVDAELLKQVIIDTDVKKLNLSSEKEKELVNALQDLKRSVGGEEKFKEIQKQIIESRDDKSLSDAIYKLATQKPFQNVIGSVSNATISKSAKR